MWTQNRVVTIILLCTGVDETSLLIQHGRIPDIVFWLRYRVCSVRLGPLKNNLFITGVEEWTRSLNQSREQFYIIAVE